MVAPVSLPWLTELELIGTEVAPLFLDALVSGGAGNPGWEMVCITIFGLVEETCSGPINSNLVDDAGENDVLSEISEAETIAEGEQFTCAGGGGQTGTYQTDGAMLISLNNGLAISVSYE
jgi:hypothetical protein